MEQLNSTVNETKRSDMFFVDPRNIQIEEGHNSREDFDLEGIIPSIRENGVKNAITCRRETIDGKQQFILTDGERRLRASLQLIKDEGLSLRIPVILEKKGSTPLSRLYDSAIRNADQKDFTPMEYAKLCDKLSRKYNQERKEIAKNLGKSEVQISQWLSLLQLPIDVQQKIQRGEVSAQVAQEVKKIAKSESEQVEILDKAIAKKKETVANSGKKSTAKNQAKVTLGDVAEITNNKNMSAFNAVMCMIFTKSEKIGDKSVFLNAMTEFYALVNDGTDIINAINEIDKMLLKHNYKDVG